MKKSVAWTEAKLKQYQLDVERRRSHAKQLPQDIERRSKFRNKVVKVDGITHDSIKEANRWSALLMSQAGGHIRYLRRQVPFVLAPGVKLAGEKRTKPPLRYYADFTYERDGQLVIEDVKSPATRTTPAYRIKKHLLKTVLNLDITEV